MQGRKVGEWITKEWSVSDTRKGWNDHRGIRKEALYGSTMAQSSNYDLSLLCTSRSMTMCMIIPMIAIRSVFWAWSTNAPANVWPWKLLGDLHIKMCWKSWLNRSVNGVCLFTCARIMDLSSLRRRCASRWADWKSNRCSLSRAEPRKKGYIESLDGKMRDELLEMEIFHSLKEVHNLIEMWRREYNLIRPHSSLGYHYPVHTTELLERWNLPNSNRLDYHKDWYIFLGQVTFLRCSFWI